MRMIWKAALGVSNIPLFAFILYIAHRIWRFYPINHWGGDVRYGWIFCLMSFCAAGGLFVIVKPLRRVTVLVCVVSVIAAIGIFYLDRCNILVEYHRWLERGLPAPFARCGQDPRAQVKCATTERATVDTQATQLLAGKELSAMEYVFQRILGRLPVKMWLLDLPADYVVSEEVCARLSTEAQPVKAYTGPRKLKGPITDPSSGAPAYVLRIRTMRWKTDTILNIKFIAYHDLETGGEWDLDLLQNDDGWTPERHCSIQY